MVAAYQANNIKRYVPHPLLTVIIIWGVTHMMVNNDVVAIIFLGSFVVCSVVATKLENKLQLDKEVERNSPGKLSFSKDAVVTGIAMLGFLLLLWLYKPLFGRTVFL